MIPGLKIEGTTKLICRVRRIEEEPRCRRPEPEHLFRGGSSAGCRRAHPPLKPRLSYVLGTVRKWSPEYSAPIVLIQGWPSLRCSTLHREVRDPAAALASGPSRLSTTGW